MSNRWHIWVDGSSSGGAGQGPAGSAYYAKKNKEFHGQGGLYLLGTNNLAETTAILLGVQYFLEQAELSDLLTIYSDSEWAVRCLAKKLQLNYLSHYNTLHYPDVFKDIVQRWDHERMRIENIPREVNRQADKLSREIKIRGW